MKNYRVGIKYLNFQQTLHFKIVCYRIFQWHSMCYCECNAHIVNDVVILTS